MAASKHTEIDADDSKHKHKHKHEHETGVVKRPSFYKHNPRRLTEYEKANASDRRFARRVFGAVREHPGYEHGMVTEFGTILFMSSIDVDVYRALESVDARVIEVDTSDSDTSDRSLTVDVAPMEDGQQ